MVGSDKKAIVLKFDTKLQSETLAVLDKSPLMKIISKKHLVTENGIIEFYYGKPRALLVFDHAPLQAVGILSPSTFMGCDEDFILHVYKDLKPVGRFALATL